MVALITLSIINILFIVLSIIYFFFSLKITTKITDFLMLRHVNKKADSFFLLPSLIILVVALLLISTNIVFIVVYNDAFHFEETFLSYLIVCAFLGTILGFINSSILKRELEKTYRTQIYSSNHLALIGSAVIYFVSTFVSFAITLYMIVSAIFS